MSSKLPETADARQLVCDALCAAALPVDLEFEIEDGPCGSLLLTLTYRGERRKSTISLMGVRDARYPAAWVAAFVQKAIAEFVEAERAKVTGSSVSSAAPAPITPRDTVVLFLTRRDATYGPEPVEYVDVPLISFASGACHPDTRVLLEGVGERRVVATATIWSLAVFRLWLKPVDGSSLPGPAAESTRDLVDGAFYPVRIPLDGGWTVARFFKRRDWAPDNFFLCVGEEEERDSTEIEEIGERIEMPADEPAHYEPVPWAATGVTSSEEMERIARRRTRDLLLAGQPDPSRVRYGSESQSMPGTEAPPVSVGIIPFPAHLGGPMLINALVPPAPAEEGDWFPALPGEPHRDPITGELVPVVEVRRGPGGEEWRRARTSRWAHLETKPAGQGFVVPLPEPLAPTEESPLDAQFLSTLVRHSAAEPAPPAPAEEDVPACLADHPLYGWTR